MPKSMLARANDACGGLTALLILRLLFFSFIYAAYAEDNFLELEQAFKFSVQMADPQTLEISYVIADGYYMYRDRFHFRADSGVGLGDPAIPAGKIKFGQTFQKNVETYRNKVSICIPTGGDTTFRLTSTAQGCTDKSLLLSLFALLLIGPSLSMFGFYELQVPASWQTAWTRISGAQGGGKLIGVFSIGAISALIVGPCVASPLAGALLYISQSRGLFIGGSGFF